MTCGRDGIRKQNGSFSLRITTLFLRRNILTNSAEAQTCDSSATIFILFLVI